MRKYNIISKYLLTGCAAMMLAASCTEITDDEQYEHYISFKAPLDTEGSSVGVTTVYVPFTRVDADGNPKFGGTGLSEYKLPVMVSGTTVTPGDIEVRIVPSDTLETLNRERFSDNRKELWYQDMSAYASYPETVTVRKGDSQALLNIRFDFNGIDLSDRYVLPLKVAESDNYLRHPRKNYATAMLRVLPYTDSSGVFEASNMKFYIVSGGVVDNEPGAMTTVQTYVVDQNTVFFYAGTFNERSLLRKSFKVYATFTPYEEGGMRGTVTLSCDNPEMNFVQNKTATYTIIEAPDEVQTYIMRRTLIINDVDYTFTDYRSAPGSTIDYNVVGTMTMERKLNTQMPEEDQIIF